MPPPANTTFGTAIDIAAVPLTTTQDAMDHDDGTVYDLWYKYTAPDSYVYGMFAYGNFSDYFVECEVYTLVLGVPTSYLGLGSNNRDDRPVYFPVTETETYYFKLVNDSDPGIPAAICNISFVRAPEDPIEVGDIFVPDERDGFPAAIIDPDTGDIRAMAVEFNDTPSVAGDVLLNGSFLVDDRSNQNFELYDSQFNLLTTVAFSWTGSYPIVRACRDGNCFYAANRVSETPSPTDFPVVKRIDASGTITDSWILPETGLVSLAVNSTETIMYNAGQGLNPASLNAPIKRWDLANDVMLSDLAAGVVGYSVRSLMVLADDTILALYGESTGTPDAFIRHYDTSGSILHTYTLGETVVTGFASNYLFQALDDPDSFWVRHHPRVGGEFNITEHTHIEVSSGTELAAVLTTEFIAGVAARFTEEASLPQFGNAPSCPVFLLQVTEPSNGTIIVIKDVVQADITESFPFEAGGGLTPTSFSLSDGESQVYVDLPAGSGYTVEETVPDGWVVSYLVSNGSPIDDLVVTEGEITTVTVTNSNGVLGFATELPIRWVRRTPVLS